MLRFSAAALCRCRLVLLVTICLQACAPVQDVVHPAQNLDSVYRKTITLRKLIESNLPNACQPYSVNSVRCKNRLTFSEIEDTDIQGGGLHIEFTNPDPDGGGLLITKSKRSRISDFTISWKDSLLHSVGPDTSSPIYSKGAVSSCAEGGILQLAVAVTTTLPIAVVSVWDDAYGWPWRFDGPPALEAFFNTKNSVRFHSGRSECLAKLKPLVGYSVITRHRAMTNHAFECNRCEGFTVDRGQIFSAPGMGFVFNFGFDLTLSNSFVRPKCVPACSSPEPSLSADAAHFSAVGKNIKVIGNDFSWQGDDGLNIASLLIKGQSISGDQKRSWLHIPEDQSWKMAPLKIGALLEIFSQNLKLIRATRIESIDIQGRRISVTDELPSEDVLISPTDHVPTNIEILGNYFHDSRARGILLTGNAARIEDNTIERTTMNGILLSSDSRTFFEGPGATDVEIRHNVIRNVNHSSLRPFYPSAISVGILPPAKATEVGVTFKNLRIRNNVIQLQPQDKAPVTSLGPGTDSCNAACVSKFLVHH